MSDIVVSKKDEVHIIVKPNDSGIIMELSEFFTFYVPGYKFVPSYRNKLWDGKIRLYNTRDYTLPSRLFYDLQKNSQQGINLARIGDGSTNLLFSGSIVSASINGGSF